MNIKHIDGSTTERAYRRGQAIERRKPMMNVWGSYCAGEAGADVVALYG